VEERITRAVEEANRRKDADISGRDDTIRGLTDAAAVERTSRYDLMRNHVLAEALLQSGVKAGKSHLHERYLLDFIAVADEGGVERVVVMGDGEDKEKIRYGSNGVMSVAEFVGEYRNREGVAEDWATTTPRGAGTGQPGQTGNRQVAVSDDLDPVERLKILRRSN
jgi:hypothetical protein